MVPGEHVKAGVGILPRCRTRARRKWDVPASTIPSNSAMMSEVRRVRARRRRPPQDGPQPPREGEADLTVGARIRVQFATPYPPIHACMIPDRRSGSGLPATTAASHLQLPDVIFAGDWRFQSEKREPSSTKFRWPC